MRTIKTFEAFHSKEVYDKKREYAARKMLKNKEINTLTENQHDILSDLCSIRHGLHSNMNEVVLSDSSDYKDTLILINDRLVESGLEKIDKIPLGHGEDFIDIDTMDGLFEYGEIPEDSDSDEYQDWYDEEYTRIHNELEELNKTIEKYLAKIDSIHKTSYCPTGLSRIF